MKGTRVEAVHLVVGQSVEHGGEVVETQFGQLKRLVKAYDEKAFFIVTNAKNVFGNGFESISEVR